jgi:chromate transport protein ChrA
LEVDVMLAFAYVPMSGFDLSSLWLLFGLAMLAMVFQGPVRVARWRVLVVAAVLVCVIGAVSLFAEDYIIRDCASTPWWTLEYWWFCSGNN